MKNVFKPRNYSFLEYENDIKDAVSYIPFFTSVWFGSTSIDELIDKNWSFFFRLCAFESRLYLF